MPGATAGDNDKVCSHQRSFRCALPLATQTTNISVPWTTRAITASEGSDFVAANGTIEFTPSSYGAQVVSVVVNGDNTFEGDETFAVDIMANASTAVVTIMDDDSVSARVLDAFIHGGLACSRGSPLRLGCSVWADAWLWICCILTPRP